MVTKVFLASDHAGFELKEILITFLSERGFQVEDLGPKIYEKDDDYPDTIAPLAREIVDKDNAGALGVAIGMSGQGEAIEANRYKGARAAVYYGGSTEVLKLSRQHNDANILSLGSKFLTAEEAKAAVIEWLTTDFSGEERHARRIAKLG